MLCDVEGYDHSPDKHYLMGTVPRPHGAELTVALCLSDKRSVGMAKSIGPSLARFDPRIIILFGTAGKMPRSKMYDVVVATEGMYYEALKEEATGLRPLHHRLEYSNYLCEQARKIRNRKGERSWVNRLPTAFLKKTPAVHFGPITSGDKTLKDIEGETYLRIRKEHGEAYAIEQEAFHFLNAMSQKHRLQAMNIRVISDNVIDKDKQNAAGSKELALDVGIAFLNCFLEELVFEADKRPTVGEVPKRNRWPIALLLLLLAFSIAGFIYINQNVEDVDTLGDTVTEQVSPEPAKTESLSLSAEEQEPVVVAPPLAKTPIKTTKPRLSIETAVASITVDESDDSTEKKEPDKEVARGDSIANPEAVEQVADSDPRLSDPPVPVAKMKKKFQIFASFDGKRERHRIETGMMFNEKKYRPVRERDEALNSARHYFYLPIGDYKIEYKHGDSLYTSSFTVLPEMGLSVDIDF